MEHLPSAEGSPVQSPLPEALNDENDPLRPEIDEEDATRTPPIGAPEEDMELAEDKDELSDDDSDLSEIDEAQFDDFDPNAVAIEERPVAVDENNIGLIGVHKRKRTEGEEEERKKKKREGRREKPKKSRKPREDDEALSGGEDLDGRRARRKKDTGERKERPRPRRASPENEENFTPEERRRRALDRKMDEALKNPGKRRRRQDGIDLEAQNDELIENMRRRMTDAAKADTDARQQGLPAMKKLQMLPEVVALLNRNTLKDQLVDPDTNLLEAVRFFLEPLNDGSLPAYNIQRELFSVLARLPITKDALVASGIGKVTLFYTKSSKPEATIKRQAERLLGEWTRPILKRSDDYRKRELTEAVYDPHAMPVRSTQGSSSQGGAVAAAAAAAVAAARARQLEAPIRGNRARVEGGVSSYHVVPKNNIPQGQAAQRMGAGGDAVFRRMKARQMGKAGGGRR